MIGLKIVLLAMFAVCLAGCDEVILNELDELRANKVKVILADQGIEAHKIRAGARWNIAVDSKEVASALKIIDSSRLLARELERAESESSPLFRSRGEKEQQIVHAIADELSRTIEGLPGVLEAHVHLNRPVQDGYDPAPRSGSASVVVVTASGCPVRAAALTEIVAGATGIERAKIAVDLVPLDQTAQSTAASQPAEPPSGPIPSGNIRPAWERFKNFFPGILLVLCAAPAGILLLARLNRRMPLTPPVSTAPPPGMRLKPRRPVAAQPAFGPASEISEQIFGERQ